MNGKSLLSIIIPLFNNREGLRRTLAALCNQSLSKEHYEVVVIDNGSNDRPEDVIMYFQSKINLKYLKEHQYLNSPYSARNRGIEQAEGEIIVLLDSTCAPIPLWLEEGMKPIQKGKADLVGGAIEFEIDNKSSIGEIYDSISNVRMKENIELKKVAKFGNLFFRKNLINKVGWFEEGLRSGGDVRWTQKATSLGFQLVYSATAKSYILPRKLKFLTSKQYRVGKGHPKIWVEKEEILNNFLKKILLGWIPPNPFWIRKRIKEMEIQGNFKLYSLLYLTGWYLRLINAIGSFVGFLKLKTYR